MSRRKQANPKSLRVSIDALTEELLNKLKENNTNQIKTEPIDISVEPSQDSFFKNMTNNQNDLNENRKKPETIKVLSSSSSSRSTSPQPDPTSANNKSIKKRQRQKFTNTPSLTNIKSDQNPSSILINGKRYYPLIFTCENCGLRYSDQSTLNTHKLNYCTKRRQTSSSRSRSRSTDSSSSSSSSSSTNSNNSRSQVEHKSEQKIELLKSVVYQCSNCLFQTDKKSAMNRHSRVHLPQKRKQMEESAHSLSSSQSVREDKLDDLDKEENKQNQNDKTKSYCKECDIQFSSIKTFQHHRNNYCQKYKTIESVVPVPIPVQGSVLSENCKKKDDTSQETSMNLSKTEPKQTIFPPNAVRMGDLVYLPVYKINERPTDTLDKSPTVLQKPLDLSRKQPDIENNISQNLPLDLSIKKDVLLPKPIPINAQQVLALNNQFNLVPSFSIENYFLSKKFNPYLINPGLLVPNLINTSPVIPPKNLHQDTDQMAENKIYDCQNCQQKFFKYKLFKQHNCLIERNNNNSPESSNCSKSSSNLNSPVFVKPEIISNKSVNKLSVDEQDFYLKHPLVKKTLSELYGNKIELFNCTDEEEIKNNLGLKCNFYMCTTCGYRGNTSRGVKQHGKLHLSSKEHFAILNVTDFKPYLIYSSLNDTEIQLNKRSVQLEEIEKVEAKQSSEEMIKIKLPITKKARLLDYNNNINKEEYLKNDVNKSQAYCSKCNIHFKHANNYLAHKKSYCKDE